MGASADFFSFQRINRSMLCYQPWCPSFTEFAEASRTFAGQPEQLRGMRSLCSLSHVAWDMSRPNKIDTCRSWLSNPPNLDHLLHKSPPHPYEHIRGGSCKPFYRHKMVFTIKWVDAVYKMSGPNPNENTIFWGGLTPEHLEITYKISIKWLVPFTNGQGASQQISAPHLESNHFAIPSFWFCHSFILFPMPPSANPGLSMGNFGIVWATCP